MIDEPQTGEPAVIKIFKPNRMYEQHDKEMSILGDAQLLTQWRCRGFGPAYVKVGRKPMYRGSDLNDWLNSRRVETIDSKQAEAMGW